MNDQLDRHFDVLIIGAGVSGIAAAYHLQDKLPDTTYAILEAREAIGGTWDLFRYPGIRSDSDLHTFGYAFKPWTGGKAIADGPAIRQYIQETAHENGIDRHVQFGTRVIRAEWSSEDAVWTATVVRTVTGERATLTSRWLFCASGYYRYDEGYTPRFEGRERFGGQIIHPQEWPQHLDYAGKRVLVIGSGATAVTLVPAMAGDAAHVTMLQRSPTYVLPVPSVDRLNLRLRRLFGEKVAYAITRRINVARMNAIYKLSRRHPRQMRRFIRWTNVKSLAGSGIDVDTHFNPTYDPWDQRLCAVPDGDLFRVLRAGTASVVTDRIRTFTDRGVELESGRELDADIIVTATGLNLQPMGGVDLVVDGEEVTLAETVAYKGLMLSDIPNFVFAIGYTNASWTLKVDLVCEYFCRLIAHAEAHGTDVCVARLPEQGIELKPLLDFDAGYVARALHTLPKQGTHAPWHLAMDYRLDTKYLRHGPVTDDAMRFLTTAPARDVASPGLPPGPRTPKALNGAFLLGARQWFFQQLQRRYGDAVAVPMPIFGTAVVVSDPDLVKAVFTAHPDVLHAGRNPLGTVLGPGSLFSMDGDRHLAERRMLLPMFHGDRMRSYEGLIEEEALRAMASWPHDQEFATLPAFQAITLRVILRAVFGADGAELAELEAKLPGWTALGQRLVTAPFLRRDLGPWSPGGRYRRYRARYDELVAQLIDKHLAHADGDEGVDVLALMLRELRKDGKAIDREAIGDELLTLLVAGHETTASSLAWAVERLRRHPDTLRRLEQEAAGQSSTLRTSTILELQRHRTIIGQTGRRAMQPFQLGPWTVPPGTVLLTSSSVIHADDRLHPHAARFDPDRYVDAKPGTYSWIPFGGGRRRCLGAAFALFEMDIVLRTLLRHFELVPTSDPPERESFRGVAFAPAKGGSGRVRRRAVPLGTGARAASARCPVEHAEVPA